MKEADEPDIAAALRERGEAVLKELIGDPTAPERPGPKRSVVAERTGDIPAGSLPTLWRDALPELRAAYDQRCAYLAMRIHATGLATVDHFKPKSKHQHLAYEWSNFRLASHQVNTNESECPFVALELLRQERVRSGDVGRARLE